MSDAHQIIFYPVGNGDTTQIILSDGRRRFLFDFCHSDGAEDNGTPEIDLKRRLKEDLTVAKREYFDVVAFTHADSDHIKGSTDFFELQHAKKYQGEGRIQIRQLWVPAAMLLEEADKDHQQEESVLLRQEARHRLLEGAGILVFSKPRALVDWLEPHLKARGESPSARDHLFIDAGSIVPGFSLANDGVEFFCHSPYVKHCDEGDIIRNRASLVLNVRLLADGARCDFLEVGDATWEELEEIVTTTRYHKNDDRLVWDLYNIPHHCSYLALNEEGQKGERETEPRPIIEDLLLQANADAYMVCCSKPIPDVEDSYEEVQPPHIQARNAYERYLRQAGGRKFLVTMEEPNIRRPEPIIFEIGGGGLTWRRPQVGAPAIITSTPPRAG